MDGGSGGHASSRRLFLRAGTYKPLGTRLQRLLTVTPGFEDPHDTIPQLHLHLHGQHQPSSLLPPWRQYWLSLL